MSWIIKTAVSLLLSMGKNVIAALVTRKMVLWALSRFAASTKTKVDDYAVQLIEAGLNNKPVEIQHAVTGLVDTWLPDHRSINTSNEQ